MLRAPCKLLLVYEWGCVFWVRKTLGAERTFEQKYQSQMCHKLSTLMIGQHNFTLQVRNKKIEKKNKPT